MQNSSHLIKRSDWTYKLQEPLHAVSHHCRFHRGSKVLPTASNNHLGAACSYCCRHELWYLEITQVHLRNTYNFTNCWLFFKNIKLITSKQSAIFFNLTPQHLTSECTRFQNPDVGSGGPQQSCTTHSHRCPAPRPRVMDCTSPVPDTRCSASQHSSGLPSGHHYWLFSPTHFLAEQMFCTCQKASVVAVSHRSAMWTEI